MSTSKLLSKKTNIFSKNFQVTSTDNVTIHEDKCTTEYKYEIDINEDFLEFKFKGKTDKLNCIINRIHELNSKKRIEDLS